ncbi:MAG: LamG domain-containing protein, partial [Planctomycetes bacterium]|nr:LamG domain-containing protein [Planctomycetota bacterium]
TPFVLNPSAGPFGVFAWVKGGAPGQVVLSQVGGINWLMASAGTGTLAGHGLTSSVRITDGAWHRIGFVWDGRTRILYVDGVAVTRTPSTAATSSSTGGLYLGTSYNLAPGTFWSGLVDEVQIYDRAVHP